MDVAASPATGHDPAAVATLTERETEILGLVGRGSTNDDIAVHLRLSQATVKTHVTNLTLANVVLRAAPGSPSAPDTARSDHAADDSGSDEIPDNLIRFPLPVH